MKKTIVSLLTAAILFFAFAAPASAEENKTCSFKTLTKYAETVEPLIGTPVSVLNKSVKIQNTLVTEADDYLVIPRGKTLRLKNGAELDGNIYIENGGKLIIESGRVFVRGTIVSDGTIIVYIGGENACIGGAAMHVSGALYVSEQGRLTEKKSDGTGIQVEFTDRISRNGDGSIVCLGKTNSKCGDIGKTPVSAVVNKRTYTSEFVESKVVVDSIETLYPSAARYFSEESAPAGGGVDQYLTILFDNGSTLTAEAMSGDDELSFFTVCGLSVRFAANALDLFRAEQADS